MFDWFFWDEFGSIKLLNQAHELGACLFGLDVGAKLMSSTERATQRPQVDSVSRLTKLMSLVETVNSCVRITKGPAYFMAEGYGGQVVCCLV